MKFCQKNRDITLEVLLRPRHHRHRHLLQKYLQKITRKHEFLKKITWNQWKFVKLPSKAPSDSTGSSVLSPVRRRFLFDLWISLALKKRMKNICEPKTTFRLSKLNSIHRKSFFLRLTFQKNKNSHISSFISSTTIISKYNFFVSKLSILTLSNLLFTGCFIWIYGISNVDKAKKCIRSGNSFFNFRKFVYIFQLFVNNFSKIELPPLKRILALPI